MKHFRLFILILLSSQQIFAADGVLEINQSCADVGCFSGDDPGFPVRITMAGSYILTGNLSVVGSNGLAIAASNVTLDLGGFNVASNGVGAHNGITLSNGVSGVSVHNGAVLSFGNLGVGGCISNCERLSFTDLQLLGNGTSGIAFNDTNLIFVLNSVAANNGGSGFFLNGDGIVIKGCTSANNGGDGIRANNEALVVNNLVTNNAGDGIDVAPRSSVIGNIVTFNEEHGINLGGETLVKNNVAHMNNQSAGAFFDIEACATCTLVDNETP